MKKILAASAAALMFLAAYGCSEKTESGESVTKNGLEYSVIGDTVKITGYTGSDTKVEIPEKIGGKNVTVISDSAFSDDTAVESITFPDTVIEVGSGAFDETAWFKNYDGDFVTVGKILYKYKGSEKSPVIPEDFTSIAEGAFIQNTDIETISVPDSITQIGSAAFGNCSSLKEITFPEKIKAIESGMFNECTALESFKVPADAEIIDSGAFSKCTSLKEVTMNDKLTSISRSAFADCISLEKIELPDTLNALGYFAFSGCTSLEEVKLSSSMKAIDRMCFYKCAALKEIVIPESVIEIHIGAFAGCTALEKATVPDTVKAFAEITDAEAEKNIFDGCTKLEIITPSGSDAQTYAEAKGIKVTVE